MRCAQHLARINNNYSRTLGTYLPTLRLEQPVILHGGGWSRLVALRECTSDRTKMAG